MKKEPPFSVRYWRDRYFMGGTSGAGSYGMLAEYKAKYLNDFAKDYAVQTVCELGCGDGNQAALFRFPWYEGYDISPDAIAKCNARELLGCSFAVGIPPPGNTYDLVLSLDVIYHLIEDEVFVPYMDQLFLSSRRYVAIYSSNGEVGRPLAPHLRDRWWTEWVEDNVWNFELMRCDLNPHKWDGNWDGTNSDNKSISDWYIYEKSEL